MSGPLRMGVAAPRSSDAGPASRPCGPERRSGNVDSDEHRGAPSARSSHTAVWTGTKMIVWGGSAAGWYLNTGGRYDPPPTRGRRRPRRCPTARDEHTAVWTGSKMIVWGGWPRLRRPCNTGGIYDPATDTWTATCTTVPNGPRQPHGGVDGLEDDRLGRMDDAPLHEHRRRLRPGDRHVDGDVHDESPHRLAAPHGGVDGLEDDRLGGRIRGAGRLVNTGGVYDPATDTWTATSTTSAPTAATDHTAVWTGSKMIVWGGVRTGATPSNTGGIYDPATDTWTATSTTNAPRGSRITTRRCGRARR